MSSISAQLAKRVSSSIRQRANGYVYRTKVDSIAPGKISARVQGSYLYKSSIEKKKEKYIDSCSCPYGATCKHTIALALLIERDQKLLDMLDKENVTSNSPLSNQMLLAQLHTIEKVQEERVRRQYASGNQNISIYYQLGASIERFSYTSDKKKFLTVKVGKWRIVAKTGVKTFNRPKPLRDFIQEYMDSQISETDKQILRLLSYCKQKDYYSYYDESVQITNDALPELWKLLENADAVLWDDEKSLILVPEPVEFFVESTEESNLMHLEPFLSIKGEKKKIVKPYDIFSYQYPVIRTEDNHLYRLRNNIDSEIMKDVMRIKPFHRKLLEDTTIIDSLLRVSQFAPIKLPLAWEEQAILAQPIPVLILDMQQSPWILDFDFRYGNRKFHSDTTTPSLFVDTENSSEVDNRICKRNFERENEYVLQLQRFLNQEQSAPFTILYEDRQRFMNEVLPALPKEWELWLKEQKQPVNRSSVDFNFTQTSSVNWLDIDGTVNVDSQALTLSALLDTVLLDQPMVKVKDKTYLFSPETMKKFTLLKKHYDASQKKIRLTPLQVGALDNFGEMIDMKKIHPVWQKTLQTLRSFKTIESAPLPKRFKATLRPYQQEGVNWLHFLKEFHFGGILADDMGLGKTIQTLAMLSYTHQQSAENKLSLIVAPTSVVSNWQLEMQKFTPTLRSYIYAGRDRTIPDTAQTDVIITSYALLWRDKKEFIKHKFHYVILDEAQYIKNHASQTSQTARSLQAEYKLSLTGTPLENNLTELWSQCAFVNPGLLGSIERFKTDFVTPIEKYQNNQAKEHLKGLLKPFLLRRVKNDVIKDLPPKIEQTVWCEMDSKQKSLYEAIKTYYQMKVFKLIEEKGIKKSQIEILEALLRLRQICCHPQLLHLQERERFHTLPKSIQQSNSSAKLDAVVELIRTAVAEGHKILLFSQFVEMLKIIEKELTADSISSLMLTGQTKDRQVLIDTFQKTNDHNVFLLSLKAGGTGLNLTAADYVIHYDPWWNPSVERQAEDRAHRIGQKKTVYTYKMLVKDSIEMKIQELQERKKGLIDDIINTNAKGKGLSKEDIAYLFQ